MATSLSTSLVKSKPIVLQTPSRATTLTTTWEALTADFVLPDDPAKIQQPKLAAVFTNALGAAGCIPQL